MNAPHIKLDVPGTPGVLFWRKRAGGNRKTYLRVTTERGAIDTGCYIYPCHRWDDPEGSDGETYAFGVSGQQLGIFESRQAARDACEQHYRDSIHGKARPA